MTSTKNELPCVLCDQCMIKADVSHVGGEYQGEFVIACHGTRQLISADLMPNYKSGGKFGGSKPITLVWSNLEPLFTTLGSLTDKQTTSFNKAVAAIADIKRYYEIRLAQGAPKTFLDRSIIDEAIDTLMLFRSDDPSYAPPKPPEPEPIEPVGPTEASIGSLGPDNVFVCDRCLVSHRRGPCDFGVGGYPRYYCSACAIAGPARPWTLVSPG